MTDRSIELDERRGMAAQKATDLRRKDAEVEAQHASLAARQQELETHLFAAAAATWPEAAAKARYLLERFTASLACEDPRLQSLVSAVLADFAHLSDPARREGPADGTAARKPAARKRPPRGSPG
ncbi:hypothetical protein OPKNFCMD_2433 [Methylobacterium crusticola]|uniref:Mobilization protein n=2 Tax=Methylobacterium crusticola TaxID=1697972 RepID=A0ABQ4QXV0_9HYPH|nr:hypothetical protein [Methylobacterium crusticola]GJD49700.1 hypothetical protein OPKNFCMD_2433 [Methylobacterium crusticola]